MVSDFSGFRFVPCAFGLVAVCMIACSSGTVQYGCRIYNCGEWCVVTVDGSVRLGGWVQQSAVR